MQVCKLSRGNEKELARKAAAALKQGKVLICPTDTVYGLLADAKNREAVQRTVQIKGRKRGKSLPIFVKDIAMAKGLARVSPFQERHMKKLWPGKVTLVLKSKGKLPEETGTKDTIGLRVPNHEFVAMLLAQLKRPMVGTSANLAGKPSILDNHDIIRQFGKRKYKPDILIEAGKLPFSRPSRVIDIINDKPVILRK